MLTEKSFIVSSMGKITKTLYESKNTHQKPLFSPNHCFLVNDERSVKTWQVLLLVARR